MDLKQHPILIVDGACGTNLQEMEIPDTAWDDKEGCNEYLNLTAPDVIQALHRSFVEAGAMILETNTFGAASIVLAEYGLEEQVDAINGAAVANARAAIGDTPHCYVAGSLGPTTKLPSLGHIGYDALYAAYEEQLRSLIGAGVDLLIVETGQDMLQMKIALVAAFDLLNELNVDLPVMASITIERTGTMLVGTDIAAATATLEPFPLFSLGLNCATGPADMISHVRYLSHHWPQRISCIPNQGLPEVVDGKTMYPLSPAEYATHMTHFVKDFGVSIVGGCCGTTPAHTRALVAALADVTPAERSISS
ncbi:MAG: 5-methyltetrahydrofolate--homocysteine methyltransferase [Verrucomicrobia bacterium]|jgi:methionine synthase I (cobalamin-dependent)|nr:5-methyltetrahydrofolate--homocysteine methyltransferase [Verrucomicrobiota bacterium]MBT7066383.1 5-methyltetrahydrofolate--homocysteine methyltransferase [Verrucomicrobiota bacterium]MBT7701531.1 5-methyltetrahydrofolate--homocysteine methyltransferase [Verrucomicrobiota bacterium]